MFAGFVVFIHRNLCGEQGDYTPQSGRPLFDASLRRLDAATVSFSTTTAMPLADATDRQAQAPVCTSLQKPSKHS